MAEADKLLIAAEFDAKGAIKNVEILDTKFKSLGASLQKGQRRTEGMTEAQEKFTNATKRTTQSTVEGNVAMIGRLQALEALTSAGNQYISAQYKKIDADLAAGKITQEQAAEERKQIKQKEKYTGRLEEVIAIARLYTVAQMFMAGATAAMSRATDANTKSIWANTIALLANPWVILGVAIAVVIAIMVDFWIKSGAVRRMIEDINESVDNAIERWNAFGDSVKGALSWLINPTGTEIPLTPAEVFT